MNEEIKKLVEENVKTAFETALSEKNDDDVLEENNEEENEKKFIITENK